jgi:hypothetical protein
MKISLLILLSSLALTGCASSGGVASSGMASNTYSVRDNQGATQYRVRDGAVLTPSGVRVARIDGRGNIYSTQGATAGQRVGKISK